MGDDEDDTCAPFEKTADFRHLFQSQRRYRRRQSCDDVVKVTTLRVVIVVDKKWDMTTLKHE